ncbi:hypothetical protein WOLCODRAFT_158977 [Wolfiporia cocos MD-104 SS10]|uniref:Uncharacterized protein n=1 Tax=Wolfiporia cocos (strain MD-104) TaxID=742152 RepID=A0A2H3JHT3_WOLCO|nr:hypothetical protein WOLCODRAFT_158977 [Wolfiporia cocos MD-104 SS10]
MGCYWYLLTENHSPAGDVVLILLTYCINPIQSIIISRFILGLSGVGHRGANGGISEMSQLPSFVQPQDPCRLPHALARLPATSFANTESRSQSGSNALCSSCGGQRSSGPLPAPTRESRVSQVEETPAYDSGADCDLFDEHVAEELGCNPTRAGDEEEGGISSP